MIKKNWLWFIAAFIIILGTVIDYKSYDIIETEDMASVLYDDLAAASRPLTSQIFLADSFADGRLRFYSGSLVNDAYFAPFIAGYRKHWLLDRYRKDVFLLIPDGDHIGKDMRQAPVTETYMHKYRVYQVVGKLSLMVERQFNYSSILRFAFLAFLFLNARYRLKDKGAQ